METNRSRSAAAGELLVLGEMLRQGFEVYKAHGQTQVGWDLVMVREDGQKRIQVKTIDWPIQLAVNGNLTEGFDYLVVVLLNRANPRSRFFIFPIDAVPPLLSGLNAARKSKCRTLTMSKVSMNNRIAIYEDNWASFLL